MSSLQTAYGFHAIQNLLKTHPEAITVLYCQAGRVDQRLQQLLAEAKQIDIPIKMVSKQTLDDLAKNQSHQGILASYKKAKQLTEDDLWTIVEEKQNLTFILILDGVEDPQNLGACLRTADATGVDCVIIPKHHSAKLTPTVHKTSAGASHHVPLIEITNLARVLEKLKDAGVTVIGTSDRAKETIYQASLDLPLALVLGGEAKGLRSLTQNLCDMMVKIPMQGHVESLNVSVATAVCLFEIVRRQHER